MSNQHFDVTIKIGLTADQFIFIRDEAEASGLSVSAMVRNMVATLQREHALNLLSTPVMDLDTHKTSRVRS